MRFSRALLPSLLLSPLALAADTGNSNTIQVHGTTIEEQLSSELASLGHQVEVITSEQIRQTGSGDVVKALQVLVPSLYISNKNGSFDYSTVSLQGSRTKDVLFLVDGVRINNRLFGGTSPLDTLSSNMVERIEVVKGGQSLFYGTQAVAGAINIITKAYSDEPKGSLSVSATTEVGQKGIAFDHAGKLPNGTRYVVAISGDKASGYTPWEEADIQPDNRDRKRGYDMINGLVKLQHDFEDSRLSLSLQRNDGKLDFARPYRTINTYNDRKETIATLKWDQYLTDDLGFYVKAYYHDWDTNYTRIENVNNATVVLDDGNFWGYTDKGINAMLRYSPNANSELIGGIDYQRYKGEDQVLLIKTKVEAATALFGQYRYQFSDATQAAVGIRRSDSQLGGTNTVWNASVKHQFNDQLYASAALGTSYALPDAYQLYSIDPDHPLGNEDLDGESSRNLNVSLGGQLANGDLDWELSAYHRRIEDLIVSSRTTVNGQTVSTRINSDSKVTSKGAGIALNYHFAPGWKARVSADINRARQDANNQQIDDVPESLAKLGLGYESGDKSWSLGADATYRGRIYHVENGTRLSYGKDWQVDLNGRWQFAPQQSVSFHLENLLDADNITTPGTGRLADDSRYIYENRIASRNLKLSYRLDF